MILTIYYNIKIYSCLYIWSKVKVFVSLESENDTYFMNGSVLYIY